MNAETIAKRFDKARREGRTWRFACPLCGKPKAWARDHSGKTYVGCFACDGDWRGDPRAPGGLSGSGESRSAPVPRANVGYAAPPSDFFPRVRLEVRGGCPGSPSRARRSRPIWPGAASTPDLSDLERSLRSSSIAVALANPLDMAGAGRARQHARRPRA